MMFSKSFEYALRAAIYLCNESSESRKLNIKQISAAIDSPEPFTAKILQTLVRRNIVSSTKGPGGGFYVDSKAKPIPVVSILDATDGRASFERCGLGLKECSESRPCPIHNEFKSYSLKLKNLLTKKTVQELALGVNEGKVFVTNF
jgi:Rrf2 family transcriptional regulator, iron-sulfur cluster assembly transcription factor